MKSYLIVERSNTILLHRLKKESTPINPPQTIPLHVYSTRLEFMNESLSINHSCPRVFAFIHSPKSFAYTLSYWFMNITGRFKKLVPFWGEGTVPLYNDNRPWRGARVALKCPFTPMDYIRGPFHFNTVTVSAMFEKETFEFGQITTFNRFDLELIKFWRFITFPDDIYLINRPWIFEKLYFHQFD